MTYMLCEMNLETVNFVIPLFLKLSNILVFNGTEITKKKTKKKQQQPKRGGGNLKIWKWRAEGQPPISDAIAANEPDTKWL